MSLHACMQKAYRLMDPTTKKIYISRDLISDENAQ